jgi:hypothetical protein
MKNTYILISIALCGVLGFGAWYATRGITETPSQEVSAVPNKEDTASSAQSQNFKGSMQELLARGGSWKCDVESTAGGVTSRGTTYVADGMVRADFVSTIPQVGDVETHLIMRDAAAYTWTSMMNRGFKFPISEAEGQTEMSAEVAAPVNQDYDFSCEIWSTDRSLFVLPTDITF